MGAYEKFEHVTETDYSPLANLVLLETLHIQHNPGVDISPLEHLTVSEFFYDDICELDGLPVEDRVTNRRYPSIYDTWDDISNRPFWSRQERIAAHDLSFGGAYPYSFDIYFQQTDQGVVLRGPLDRDRQRRDELLAMNPNLVFITSVAMRDSSVNKLYPQDFPHWVRDATGTPVEGWPGTFLLDFTHPAVQDIIVSHARAISRCGVYDGLFLDWWQEHTTVLDGYRSNAAEQRARDVIIANYPNPFNPETWMPYQLATPAEIIVSIYDVRGIVVRQLLLGHQTAGVYQSRSRAAYWDGRNALGERVASGLYFYTLTAGDYTTTRRMLILK